MHESHDRKRQAVYEPAEMQVERLQWIKNFFGQRKKEASDVMPEKKVLYRENPYLPQIREIMEQILAQKGIPYGDFAPVLIDGSDSQITIKTATALAEDLNHLTILTEIPAYFMELAEIMYEEQGLIVEIFSKKDTINTFTANQLQIGTVILDFEQPDETAQNYCFGKKIYIPIFKKSWEVLPASKHSVKGISGSMKASQENGRNLDIAVPIGYNTVIVSIGEAKQKCPCMDKFERAFWLEQ